MPSSTLADRRCEDCSHPIDDTTTVTTVEGHRLCRACADRLDTCDDCATPTRERRSTVRGTDVCTECSIGWRRCRDCDRFDSDLIRVIGHGEVCDDCADSYLVCDDCGSRADGLNETESGTDVCGRCEDADYRRCGSCDILIRCWEDYCDTCANQQPDHHGIHSYDYKPEPDFHGTGPLYLGLELEIKTPRDVFGETAELAIGCLGDLGYLKHDRRSHHARALLHTLAANPHFAELWTTHPTTVSYGRPSGKPVLLRHSGSRGPAATSLQIGEFHSPHAILVAYAISKASAECR